MQNRKPLCVLAAILLISCAISGCGGLTIGPRTETRYVIVHPGRPLQILGNKTVRGRVLDGTGDAVEQDIGGWIAMPAEHWNAIVDSGAFAPAPEQPKGERL